jgi:hypothetical protein
MAMTAFIYVVVINGMCLSQVWYNTHPEKRSHPTKGPKSKRPHNPDQEEEQGEN